MEALRFIGVGGWQFNISDTLILNFHQMDTYDLLTYYYIAYLFETQMGF